MKSTLYAILFILVMFIIATLTSCTTNNHFGNKHFTKLGKHECLVSHHSNVKTTKTYKTSPCVFCPTFVNHK